MQIVDTICSGRIRHIVTGERIPNDSRLPAMVASLPVLDIKNFDDKPLFGKLKGTYWWNPHVRGTEESGVVEKDYRIKV